MINLTDCHMHQPMSVAAAKLQSNAWHFSVKPAIDRIGSLALKRLSAIHSDNRIVTLPWCISGADDSVISLQSQHILRHYIKRG